jgi:hypothetical protein
VVCFPSLWFQIFDSPAQGLELQTKESMERQWADKVEQFGQRQKGNESQGRLTKNSAGFSF